MHLRDGFLADQLDPIYVAYNMWTCGLKYVKHAPYKMWTFCKSGNIVSRCEIMEVCRMSHKTQKPAVKRCFCTEMATNKLTKFWIENKKNMKTKHKRSSINWFHQFIFWRKNWSVNTISRGPHGWSWTQLINYSAGFPPLTYLASCCETELPCPCNDQDDPQDDSLSSLSSGSLSRIPLPR